MFKNQKEDPIPYYCTLPLLQPKYKSENGNTTVPSEESVQQTRDWSKELKL